jgi:hypothetical protein
MSGALHLWPHLSFLGRLEHFSRDWAALNQLLGTDMTPHDATLGDHVTSKSPNQIKENTLKLLAESPEYARALCHLLLVDYTCLAYPLPAACADITPPYTLGCKNVTILSAALGRKQAGNNNDNGKNNLNLAAVEKAKTLSHC